MSSDAMRNIKNGCNFFLQVYTIIVRQLQEKKYVLFSAKCLCKTMRTILCMLYNLVKFEKFIIY